MATLVLKKMNKNNDSEEANQCDARCDRQCFLLVSVWRSYHFHVQRHVV